MKIKGGGYVVVYIRAHMFCRGQSLSDVKDQRLSTKVWNSGTTFLNSLICGTFYTHCMIGTQLSGFVGAFSLSDRTQANLLAKV